MKTATNSIDSKIASLRSGGRVILSSIGLVRVAAERSGDGKTLRFVRETLNRHGRCDHFDVIRTTAY